jgi:transcriptional regulator with XRE-family HTH domain
MEYGKRLAIAIEMSELRPREARALLAEAIGASTQAISQVLKGESKALTAENNARAAKFLKVDAYWLATGEGEPKAALSQAALAIAERYDSLTALQREKWERSIRNAAAS